MCGEKLNFGCVCFLALGSPPRVRGKAAPFTFALWLGGITPACAGKRFRISKFVRLSRDHPRVCGEKLLFRHAAQCCRGSPPRVRGKGLYCCRRFRATGITPACAGKSTPFSQLWRFVEDHPRVCGEKLAMLWPLALCVGSPPRVRGKAKQIQARPKREGITPACAGKSFFVCLIPCISKDHPRVCGEKFHRMCSDWIL